MKWFSDLSWQIIEMYFIIIILKAWGILWYKQLQKIKHSYSIHFGSYHVKHMGVTCIFMNDLVQWWVINPLAPEARWIVLDQSTGQIELLRQDQAVGPSIAPFLPCMLRLDPEDTTPFCPTSTCWHWASRHNHHVTGLELRGLAPPSPNLPHSE